MFQMRIVLFLIKLIGALSCKGEALSPLNYRLPRDVLPSAYNLTIRPYLGSDADNRQFTFDGEVLIDVVSRKTLNEIVLHSKNLNYSKMEYWEKTKPDEVQKFVNSTIDPATEKLTLKLSEDMLPNTIYQLHFIYVGEISKKAVGFFRNSFNDSNNEIRWIGVTKFKPHYARRALPCFDEPSFRATFQVTIVRQKNYKTASNTRMSSTNMITPNMYSDVYERSVPISTHNLAFLISEMTEIGNEKFKIFVQPKYSSQTNYSYEIGQKLLHKFDEYLSLPFYDLGVDKLDLATITDFEGDLIENWGLLTFSQSHFLSESDSITSKARICLDIAFQLTQMWFGNLVACEWWTYAWMNEGFASYISNMLTAAIYPEWEVEKLFVVHNLQYALTIDASVYSRPLNCGKDGNPKHLDEVFDEITSKKSSSIIRMIRYAMGAVAFRASLMTYLNEFKYKTVVPGNLMKHWQDHWPNETKEYGSKVFDSFTNQVGYPLIMFNVSNDGSKMEISQKHFGSNNSATDSLLYTVPLTYTTSKEINFNSTEPKCFLEAKSNPTIIDLPSVDWVIGNIQQTGYYRVNYNDENWLNIHRALIQTNRSGIPELNRAQIVSDLLSLAQLGEVSYSLALKCLDYLKTETSSSPWTAAFYGYTPLKVRLGSTYKSSFSAYIVRLTEGIFNHLGFENRPNDSLLDIDNRRNVISWACLHGNEKCVQKALTYYDAMETTPIPDNLHFVIYCIAMAHATSADQFNTLFNKYKTTMSPSEKSEIFCSFVCVTEPTLVKNFLEIIMGDDVQRQNKAKYMLGLCEVNPNNVSPVLKFIVDNFDRLTEALGSTYEVAKLIYQMANVLTTQDQKSELQTLIQNKKSVFGDSIYLLREAMKIVEQNFLWDSKYLIDIVNHLQVVGNASAERRFQDFV